MVLNVGVLLMEVDGVKVIVLIMKITLLEVLLKVHETEAEV